MSVNYRMDKYIMVDSYNGLSYRTEYEWTVPAHLGLPGDSVVKNLPASRRCKRHGFNPWVRKIPWSRKWQPLQHSCLESPMDRGTWWATAHGVATSQTLLSDWAHVHTHQAKAEIQRTSSYFPPEIQFPVPWLDLTGNEETMVFLTSFPTLQEEKKGKKLEKWVL